MTKSTSNIINDLISEENMLLLIILSIFLSIILALIINPDIIINILDIMLTAISLQEPCYGLVL